MSLPAIRADLAQHVIYGYGAAALACAGLALAALVLEQPQLRLAAPGVAVLGALAAGLAKETADWWRNWRERRRHRVMVQRWHDSLLAVGALPEPPLRPAPALHQVAMADLVATVLGSTPLAVVALMVIWGFL